MDVNVKDLNKFIGPDGVTVLDEVRVSPTEPAFRQNGYETNGDKKSFALGFTSSNQEFIQFDSDIVLSGDFEMMFDITSDISSNFQSLAAFGSNSRLLLFAGGKIYYKTDTDSLYLSSFDKLPRTGSFIYEIKRVGNNTMFYVDGTLVDTISGYNGDITIDRLMNSSSAYFDGDLRAANIDGNNLYLTRGLGVYIIGSNNTTGEIKTSAANPQQRVNFGMWLKGDDVNGWNPYTV